jgi:butyrate kinase
VVRRNSEGDGILFKILVLNPGSTSTKTYIYEGSIEVQQQTLRHDVQKIGKYPTVVSQLEFRLGIIKEWLASVGRRVKDFDAIAARGGALKPIVSGTYLVNERIIEDLREARYGEHASNLGALIAKALVEGTSVPAFIVDPIVVDELQPEARLSGHPLLPRRSIFHALNQKAVARRAAKDLGKRYQDCRLVVAHLGGGISVAAHDRGQVVDVNNALDGEGPFTPERSGTLPAGQLVELCFSGKYSRDEVMRMVKGKGGLAAYLGTTDVREVEKRIAEGDPEAEAVFRAMAYQISKEIGAQSAVLEGKVDAIVLTGGIAYSERLVKLVSDRVKAFAPVLVYPGEDEGRALAEGVLRVLEGEERALEYI